MVRDDSMVSANGRFGQPAGAAGREHGGRCNSCRGFIVNAHPVALPEGNHILEVEMDSLIPDWRRGLRVVRLILGE